MSLLEIGSPSPTLTLPDQTNKMTTVPNLQQSWALLYFYPKASTSGCTVQAHGIRDHLAEFTARGIAVVGISPDSVKSIQKFHQAEGLNFTLLADETTEICQKYGVWQEKSMYGKTYLGVARTSYLVDPLGIIRAVLSKVTPKTHVDDALSAFDSLK